MTDRKSKRRMRISPAFVTILLLTAAMWLIKKLDYTYTAPMSVPVVFLDVSYNVSCVVEGSGHDLLASKLSRDKVINIERRDVRLHNGSKKGYYDMDAESLKSVITLHYTDLRVISVEPITDIFVP